MDTLKLIAMVIFAYFAVWAAAIAAVLLGAWIAPAFGAVLAALLTPGWGAY